MIRTSAEPMIEVCEENLMNPLWTGRPKLSAKIERNILVFETRVGLNVLVQGRGQTVDSEASTPTHRERAAMNGAQTYIST